MKHHIFDYDDLPTNWQETAKRDGIRAINREANKTPATQADIIKLEREQERVAADVDGHARHLGLKDIDRGDGWITHQQPRLGQHRREINDLRRELSQMEGAKANPALLLAVIGLVFSLVALAIAIFS